MKKLCYFISQKGNLVKIEKGSSISTDLNNSILNYVYDFYNEKEEANPIFTTSAKKKKINYQIIESYNGQFNSLKTPCYIYCIHNEVDLINKNYLTKDVHPIMREKIDNLLEFLLQTKNISLLNNKEVVNKPNIKILNKTISSSLHYNLINLRDTINEVFDEETRNNIKANIEEAKQKIKKKFHN